jgi:hypothetical protein
VIENKKVAHVLVSTITSDQDERVCVPFLFFNRSVPKRVTPSLLISFVRNIKTSGSTVDLFRSLASFGIQVDQLPMTSSGAVKTSQLRQWINTQRSLDRVLEERLESEAAALASASDASNQQRLAMPTTRAMIEDLGIIECPNPQDILFSSGGKYSKNVANVDFLAIIEAHIRDFQDRQAGNLLPSTKERAEGRRRYHGGVIRSVRTLIKGSRFLSQTAGGWWVEHPPESKELDEKVKNAISNHERRLKNRLDGTDDIRFGVGDPSCTASEGSNTKRLRTGD